MKNARRIKHAYRGVNVLRVALLLVPLYAAHAHEIRSLLILNYLCLALAVLWILLTELLLTPKQESGRLSFLPTTMDLVVISFAVYYTGTVNSFAVIGFLYMTGTCALNPKVRQDLLALVASSVLYPGLALSVYWEWLPPVHILGGRSAVSLEYIGIATLCFLVINFGLHSIIRTLVQRLLLANEHLSSLAMTDKLTGLGNRRRFDNALALEWRRLRRHQRSLALILLDVDHFKDYNDNKGHQYGDECLQALAAAIRECFARAEDCAARIGGEEFAVLLVETDQSQAIGASKRLQEAVAALRLEHPTSVHGRVTFSAGIACCVPEAAISETELFRVADEALYKAKRSGRNCCYVGRIENGSVALQPA